MTDIPNIAAPLVWHFSESNNCLISGEYMVYLYDGRFWASSSNGRLSTDTTEAAAKAACQAHKNAAMWDDMADWARDMIRRGNAESARLQERFRIKAQCDRCGHQTMDAVRENTLCPNETCSGKMVPK